ncbi:uncharacterized protein METZ01_LOCUS112775 [marine metagenome]|uniref:Phosphatidic acid phosphatase type 2/haloperoxidase domain-containing protein n=1 Tax=marine metagenome TaxID=408172 RepID=A0A381X5Z9_9ZZZZ
MMLVILLSTIPLRNLLTRDEPDKRLRLSDLPAEIRAKGYYWHISLYVVMYLVKLVIDMHSEPVKARVGGYTHWVHGLEGDFTLWAQEAMRSDLLTDILSFHYLFVYLFVIWMGPLYYILVRDHVMADKAALNYFVIYLLAVPLYLFFNVEVTSSYIPGMDALLYHDSWYLEFVTNNDPMDNGIPSLHFGLPVGLLIINRLHCREKGIDIREWRHREFDLFVMANCFVYLFSIQYLGIHWILDIIPGIILAVICAYFVHEWQPRIRARPQNGWKSLIPEKRSLTTAAVFALLCTAALATVAVDGPGSDEDIPNMRLGPGDVNIDTIEVHSLWDPVGVEVSNVGEHSVHAIILHRSLVVEHVDRGTVDWESIVGSLPPAELQDMVIDPGISWQTEVSTPSIFDTHLILVKPAFVGEYSEVRVTMHYVDDELIWTAMILSVPAFLIAGLVIDQKLGRSEDEMGEQRPNEKP